VEETRELELVPVMNLFMVLIPFLLMGAAFYQIGVIPSSLPTSTPDDSDVPRTPTKVTVNLIITPDRIDLGASSTSLDEEQLEALGGSWPLRDGKYDTEGVQAQLLSIKQRYPHSDTLIALPHEELDYQSLVEILDRTREFEAPPAGGAKKTYELFPVVVFSRFIPPPPADETAEGEAAEDETAGEVSPSGEQR
jgi:biopolymer transport protein ExbD